MVHALAAAGKTVSLLYVREGGNGGQEDNASFKMGTLHGFAHVKVKKKNLIWKMSI